MDDNARRAADLNKHQWRCNILLRFSQDCLGQVTMKKCAALCGRVHRYIPVTIAVQLIVD